MPDYKADHNRKFCRICKQSEYSIESGIICGLTKRKADFVETCPDFKVDKVEVKNVAINTKANLLARHYDFYDRVSQFKPRENPTTDKRALYESKFNNIYIISCLAIILVVMIGNFISNNEKGGWITYGVLSCLSILLIVYGYRDYKRKRVAILMDRKGFKIKKKRFYWIEIAEIVVKHNSNSDSFDFRIHTYLTNGTYDITTVPGTKVSRDELSSILKDYWFHSGQYIEYPIED